MATYLKAVCECKEWSETDLVVVEDVKSLMSFAYFMKRRWRLNQPGFGWLFLDAILLFVTGGLWFAGLVGFWLGDNAYLVSGYLLCMDCGSHLEKSCVRVPQVEMSVTTETAEVADTSMSSKLKEAAELHSQGILSDEEFQDLKSRILKE
jgi:uncharacterized membrane protein